MVNSRQKGKTGEQRLARTLSEYSGKEFSLVPGSGNGKIKGDITCDKARYCIEVKAYAASSINDKMLTNKSNEIMKWWDKLVPEAKLMDQTPLLVVKYNRSGWFAIQTKKPKSDYLYVSSRKIYITPLVSWLEKDKPKFSR